MTNNQPIDWTRPIVIAATDWQGELPARVVDQSGREGEFRVAVKAPHRLREAGPEMHSGQTWYFMPDGTFMGASLIRVINKQADIMIEAGGCDD